MLGKCKDGENDIVKHLKQTGIYFLLGKDQGGYEDIYIGQAGRRNDGTGLLKRLLEHNLNENENYYDDWDEVICLTTKDDVLGPTEISYLENKFTKLANSAERYHVRNVVEPTQGNITEEKESEMEEFIEYAKIIVGVLGHKVFEPLINKVEIQPSSSLTNESPIFYFHGKYKASAKKTNEGFVVLANSQINPKLAPSVKGKTRKDRELYKDKIDPNFITLTDLLFTSPSAAATFVNGAPSSGNELWRTVDNKNPKDYEL